MARAKKLPSGSWRVRVFSHKDKDGKSHYESFTALSKAEAEAEAATFAAKKQRRVKHDLTVAEAIDGYITAKTGTVSPSTIRGYRRMENNQFDDIKDMKVKKLTSESVQRWISSLSKDLSAKTVANAHALFNGAIGMYAPDMVFRVTLPKKKKAVQTAPSDDDVAKLFQAADPKLKICIALAAFGSLRRGEVCALKYGDIEGDTIFVHADLVQDENDEWIYKDMPKEAESVRRVALPHEVVKLLGEGEPDEYIVKYALPNTVSNRFLHLRRKLGLELRYHDLRHYFASIGAVLGIPDTYLSEFGGWRKDSPVMKNVYQNKIVPISEAYQKKMVKHFAGVMDKEEI